MTVSTPSARHLLLRFGEGARLPEALLGALRDEVVLAGWVRASGVLAGWTPKSKRVTLPFSDLALLGAVYPLIP